jgi:hypothetical protein
MFQRETPRLQNSMNKPRPNSVKMAIGCLIVSCVIASIQALLKISKSEVYPYKYDILGFFIMCFLIFMIYRCKNWARWLYAGFIALWLVGLVAHIKSVAEYTNSREILLIVHLILGVTAVFMLFTHASNVWFRANQSQPKT